MSNESELLKRLGLTPDACVKVDCYWKPDGDVQFVQIQAESYAGGRACGIYARQVNDDVCHLNILVVVREDRLSQRVVETSLMQAQEALASAPDIPELLVKLRERT